MTFPTPETHPTKVIMTFDAIHQGTCIEFLHTIVAPWAKPCVTN